MKQSELISVWNYPTRIVHGDGALALLGRECRALGAERVFVIADRGVAAAGLTERVQRVLKAGAIDCAFFDDISSNPTEQEVENAALAYQDFGRGAAILGLGGGSPMDCAKLVAVRAATNRPFEELDDAIGGDQYIPSTLAPIIAVPTTAGTGSEVGRASVVTIARTHRKTVIFSPAMLPRVAILDPRLTVGLPPGVTAATGFDALTHCVEAYVAKGHHPMADAIALAGVGMCAAHLRDAVQDGGNIEARAAMMAAAMMGAVAFQKGLGACHSLAHPLSAICGIHHGLANALCLPVVVQFNQQSVPERLAKVAAALGAGVGESCADALATFRASIGLPSSLSSCGVQASQLEQLATEAHIDACHRGNPRECSREDLLMLLKQAF